MKIELFKSIIESLGGIEVRKDKSSADYTLEFNNVTYAMIIFYNFGVLEVRVASRSTGVILNESEIDYNQAKDKLIATLDYLNLINY